MKKGVSLVERQRPLPLQPQSGGQRQGEQPGLGAVGVGVRCWVHRQSRRHRQSHSHRHSHSHSHSHRHSHREDPVQGRKAYPESY